VALAALQPNSKPLFRVWLLYPAISLVTRQTSLPWRCSSSSSPRCCVHTANSGFALFSRTQSFPQSYVLEVGRGCFLLLEAKMLTLDVDRAPGSTARHRFCHSSSVHRRHLEVKLSTQTAARGIRLQRQSVHRMVVYVVPWSADAKFRLVLCFVLAV
jgi:hypothetical protein